MTEPAVWAKPLTPSIALSTYWLPVLGLNCPSAGTSSLRGNWTTRMRTPSRSNRAHVSASMTRRTDPSATPPRTPAMSDNNIAVIQQIYQAFGRGDVAGIMEHIAAELHGFGVVSESSDVPWHVQITRKADVPSFFQALAKECDFTRFEPRDFVAGGDQVYVTVRRFTLKAGRVVEWRGTEDTAKTQRAFFG